MNIMNGILAATLAFTGGAGISLNSEKDIPKQNTIIQEQGVNYNQMADMMKSANFGNMQTFMEEDNMDFNEMQDFMEAGNMNFGQMKPYMSERHPNLDNQQLEEMYKGMHGTGGSAQSSKFKEIGCL
ncbi:hypothetical protein AB3U99_06680 [Niallia sp. JL1B1071]|uniref:hypothetical protein n=1 Tax=Niallia tiangongensis TaxID=3237105 RepID=UPI0037DC14AA